MDFSSFFRMKRAAPDRQHRHRPVLECLEGRHLLSAGYGLVNLSSDVPGLARVTDPNQVNPWGIAYSPTGPFWFAENGSGVSDILDGRGEPFSLVVTVLSAGHTGSAPTGTVFNGRAGFVISENRVSAPSRFLFANEDGTISGWTTIVDPTHTLLAVDNSISGAVYTGLALATDPTGHSFLYAADFSRGTIDVFDQDFRQIVRPDSFHDPSLPDGFAPFNVQNINNLLFVTYAQQSEDRKEAVASAGHGFIDVYDPAGNLVRRFTSQGALNAPWGLALAPADFGPLGGALLVGNNGDGHINAYDPRSGTFLGELAEGNGLPIAIPYLWSLTFGNGHVGGDSDTLFFTAGVDDEEHGLFGAIQAPEKRGADTAGTGKFDPSAPGEPGDYPLPPRDGPAFRASSEDRPIPVADLLPSGESSLVLVPTLSTISEPGMSIEAPVPAGPIRVVASGGSAFTTVSASSAFILHPADGNPQPARVAPNGAVALNSFLDWSAPRHVPRNAGAERPNPNSNTVVARSLPSADDDFGTERPSSEAYLRLETQASEEPGAGAPPPAGQAEEVLAAVPSAENHATLAGEPAGGNDRVEPQGQSGWTKLMHRLFVLSILMLWIRWAVTLASPVGNGSGTPREKGPEAEA
jgi:uncharacterized protein (TIGR03118 family)